MLSAYLTLEPRISSLFSAIALALKKEGQGNKDKPDLLCNAGCAETQAFISLTKTTVFGLLLARTFCAADNHGGRV